MLCVDLGKFTFESRHYRIVADLGGSLSLCEFGVSLSGLGFGFDEIGSNLLVFERGLHLGLLGGLHLLLLLSEPALDVMDDPLCLAGLKVQMVSFRTGSPLL